MTTVRSRFEHRKEALLPRHRFLVRMLNSVAAAAALIALSLLLGMAGYRALEHLSWIDSFLSASMLLGGMGPVTTPVTVAGKLFAGVFALYSGLVVIFVAGIILAPLAHRVLHRFHLEGQDES